MILQAMPLLTNTLAMRCDYGHCGSNHEALCIASCDLSGSVTWWRVSAVRHDFVFFFGPVRMMVSCFGGTDVWEWCFAKIKGGLTKGMALKASDGHVLFFVCRWTEIAPRGINQLEKKIILWIESSKKEPHSNHGAQYPTKTWRFHRSS